MFENKDKILSVIDKIIFGCIILFMLSLTNSIFINQLGYYGALLGILVKFGVTREWQFRKTGLELFFALFLLAEFLSAIFSDEHGRAFLNMFKRMLLIPTLYTVAFAADDMKKAKLFFKVFIGASMVSIIIYLVNSYYYYVYNLYQIKESGPSLFQYPITTSEIMSFTVVFLFAFLINEKQSFKNKFFVLILFMLSVLALISTYKRTGWIGTGAGLFAIILIKRNWKLILPVVFVAGVIFLFIGKNKSEVYFYNIKSESGLAQTAKLNTEGRANGIYTDSKANYISDFENGILKLNGAAVVGKYNMPSPVLEMNQWGKYLTAYLIDSRFLLLEKDSIGNIKQKSELISSGFTTSYRLANNYLYIMDKDSGLTIFRNPDNLKDVIRLSGITADNKIYVDSARMIFYSVENGLCEYSVKQGLPEGSPVYYKLKNAPDYVCYIDGRIIISDIDGLKLYSPDSHTMNLLKEIPDVKKICFIEKFGAKLLASDLNKNVYLFDHSMKDSLKIIGKYKLNFIPKAIALNKNELIVTNVRRNRLTSMIDPYLPSNFNRMALWRAGFLMLKDHPLFGVGDIDLNNLYRQYKRNYDKELQGHLHNNYIHFLAILGGFGFIVVMILLGKIIQFNYKIYNEVKTEPFVSSYALGAFGGYISFLFAGLTEWNFGDHEVITMAWWTVGLNFTFYYLIQQKRRINP